MMRSFAFAFAALAGLSTAHAQQSFGARTFEFPAAPPGTLFVNGNVPTWAASVVGDPTRLIGGSGRSGATSILLAQGPVGVLATGRNPFVAQESNTGRYWGLGMDGNWAPLVLPQPATVTVAQDLYVLDDGAAVHVFQTWKNGWTSETLISPTHSVIPGRNFAAVIDGNTRLIGFSKLTDTPATRLDLGSGATWPVQHIAGDPAGETLTRRNSAAFEIGDREIAVYSGYLDAWQRFVFPASLTNYSFNYDKNVIAIKDPFRNELFMYSAHTGTMQQIALADVGQAGIDAQDFAVKIVDTVGNNTFCFCAIDGSLVLLPGQGVTVTGQLFGNNHLTVQVTDPQTNNLEYHGVSGSKRASQFVPAGYGAGEILVADGVNDMTAIVVSDRALYGFSAFTNSWARFPNWQGSYVSRGAQDFMGRVVTSSHVYVFSAREARWIERALAPGATVNDTDQLVLVTEGNSQSVYGMESTAFRTQVFTGTRFASGRSNSYSYSIHDDVVTGGSRVWFFQSYGDRWIEHAIASRLADPAAITALEDTLLIKDGTKLHVFSGFADLSSVFSAPKDNYAYHAFPGARARFLANGEPNAAALLLVGIARTDLPIPGITGHLLIDPSSLVGVPAGAYDARGNLRFTLGLAGLLPGIVRMQMASFAPATGVQLGRLLSFEIF